MGSKHDVEHVVGGVGALVDVSHAIILKFGNGDSQFVANNYSNGVQLIHNINTAFIHLVLLEQLKIIVTCLKYL